MRPMTRYLTLILVLVGLSGLSPCRADVRIHRVDLDLNPCNIVFVSVTDAGGKPVDNLLPGQFRVLENDEPQSIALVGNVRDLFAGTDVVMVLDVSGSMQEASKLEQARTAASSFLKMLDANDRVALYTFSDSVRQERAFTRNRDEVASSLAQVQANGGTALYQAIWESLDYAHRASENPVLIVLTDGLNTGSPTTLSQCVARADGWHIPVYTVGLGSDAGDNLLKQLSTSTGGLFFAAPQASDLAGLYAGIARQLKSLYLIKYHSNGGYPLGSPVRVQVQVVGQGAVSGALGYASMGVPSRRAATWAAAVLLGLFFLGAFGTAAFRGR